MGKKIAAFVALIFIVFGGALAGEAARLSGRDAYIVVAAGLAYVGIGGVIAGALARSRWLMIISTAVAAISLYEAIAPLLNGIPAENGGGYRFPTLSSLYFG